MFIVSESRVSESGDQSISTVRSTQNTTVGMLQWGLGLGLVACFGVFEYIAVRWCDW